MGTRGLFVLLCSLQHIQGIQGSAVLDSLTCVNNYKTHWRCQWKISAEAHELLPMNLIYWSDVTSSGSQLCEPDDSGEIKDGELYMTCRINEKFIYTMTTTYTFQPKRDVSRNTHIIPNSNVRMPPPEGLMVQKSGSRNSSITLRWRMPDNVSYPRLLLYQIAYYRKDWETWEDAAVLNVMGKTEISFSPQLFVPGSTYIFRVRSVPDQEQLYRSAWSNHIAWIMPEEEDRAIPQNLHCEYDGLTQMKCNWEVRKELRSMSYVLYYTDGADYGTTKMSIHERKPCNNLSRQLKDETPYILYSCTFQIPSSQANRSFHIQVQPQEELRNFRPYEHSELSSTYMLGWSPPEVSYSTIKLTYQLCYWKQGDEECPDLLLVNVSGNVPEYYIPNSELLSSTNYIAKLRAKPDDSSGYNGPWSDLESELFHGQLTQDSWLGLYFVITYFKRLKQQWENSIPDPKKSKLSKFLLGYGGTNFPPFISQDFFADVEGPLVSHISPIESPKSTSEAFVMETPAKPNASPLGPYSMAPPTAENVQNHQASCKLLDIAHEVKAPLLSQPTEHLSKMDHNSPYFIFTQAQSMSNLIAKQSKSSDYFMLPKCNSKMLSPPKEFIPSCQTISPVNEMCYVLNMKKHPPLQTPQKDDDPKKSRYFTIPSPSDVKVPQEGPLMITNPDGTGPLVLKQVGDYCFFPGIHGSQENLEKKMTPVNDKVPPHMAKDPSLPAVQEFKVMQRDYLALPQN
ncbi:cytokine receptor common subunit beta [Bufo bufo]|uniref:cytokine receptor common subunit beta n=1 Tax=Bufo bufo TaxID=8384 RepID=UPI001ABEB6B7|nr:cytokine receptor common subunit beta [Bufo bufo]